MPTIKFCRRCGDQFEPDDPRRTVCNRCRPPEDREREKEQARKMRGFKPLTVAADFTEELVELAPVLADLDAVSQGSLVGALRRLTNTEGREGVRGGLIRVAAIAVALARRLR